MNRRTFFAAIAAIPAAAIETLRRPTRLWIDWTPIKPPSDELLLGSSPISASKVAKIFRVPVHLIGDDGASTFGQFEKTEAAIAELRAKWIETMRGPREADQEYTILK